MGVHYIRNLMELIRNSAENSTVAAPLNNDDTYNLKSEKEYIEAYTGRYIVAECYCYFSVARETTQEILHLKPALNRSA